MVQQKLYSLQQNLFKTNKIEVFGYASNQVAILNDGEATSGTMKRRFYLEYPI